MSGKNEGKRLDAVLLLAKACHEDLPHAEQDTALALALFDALQPLHGLGDLERRLLQYGALLHDVGWVEGGSRHHKHSYAIIRAAALPFSEREQTLIALVARYHRKALPKAEHAPFAALSPDDQALVRWLGGILRVADGLDSLHRTAVKGLTCEIKDRDLLITVLSDANDAGESAAAEKKGDLLEAVTGKVVCVSWQRVDG